MEGDDSEKGKNFLAELEVFSIRPGGIKRKLNQ